MFSVISQGIARKERDTERGRKYRNKPDLMLDIISKDTEKEGRQEAGGASPSGGIICLAALSASFISRDELELTCGPGKSHKWKTLLPKVYYTVMCYHLGTNI